MALHLRCISIIVAKSFQWSLPKLSTERRISSRRCRGLDPQFSTGGLGILISGTSTNLTAKDLLGRVLSIWCLCDDEVSGINSPLGDILDSKWIECWEILNGWMVDRDSILVDSVHTEKKNKRTYQPISASVIRFIVNGIFDYPPNSSHFFLLHTNLSAQI